MITTMAGKRRKCNPHVVLPPNNVDEYQSTSDEEFHVDNPQSKLMIENQNPVQTSNELKPKKRRMFKMKKELLSICCEWNMCINVYNKQEDFLKHIKEHLDELPDYSEDGFVCYWRDCGSICDSKSDIDRHVYYHCFHTKLKSIGANFLNENESQCFIDPQGRNLIPEIPDNFQCMWNKCNMTFESAQEFYWHVENHTIAIDATKDKGFLCQWENCFIYKKCLNRLKDHCRAHTQEKIIGCPNCGGIFANNTKLLDHCNRQLPKDKQNYECSHCSRKFSSERFLRDHLRYHINHYKCPQCDMTCATKSSLLAHIKYRHSKFKPFKCSLCGKGFTTNSDLGRHIVLHTDGNPYHCLSEGCTYSCRSSSSLNLHVKRKHVVPVQHAYACHICGEKYKTCTPLTKHLVNVHEFQWPPGHVRFKYKKEDDGLHRLQTVRYESISINNEEELTSEQIDQEPNVNSSSSSIENKNKLRIEEIALKAPPRLPLRATNELKKETILSL